MTQIEILRAALSHFESTGELTKQKEVERQLSEALSTDLPGPYYYRATISDAARKATIFASSTYLLERELPWTLGTTLTGLEINESGRYLVQASNLVAFSEFRRHITLAFESLERVERMRMFDVTNWRGKPEKKLTYFDDV